MAGVAGMRKCAAVQTQQCNPERKVMLDFSISIYAIWHAFLQFAAVGGIIIASFSIMSCIYRRTDRSMK